MDQTQDLAFVRHTLKDFFNEDLISNYATKISDMSNKNIVKDKQIPSQESAKCNQKDIVPGGGSTRL